MGKPSKGTPADQRLKANNPNAGKGKQQSKPMANKPATKKGGN